MHPEVIKKEFAKAVKRGVPVAEAARKLKVSRRQGFRWRNELGLPKRKYVKSEEIS
jgi:Homeodomain-like domain